MRKISSLPYFQSSLDSLCGVYSIVNAYRIVKDASYDEAQEMFNEIIEYLSRRRMLKDIILGGMLHKNMADILFNVVKDDFIEKLTLFRWGEYSLDEFWIFSKNYLDNEHTAIILSIGGISNHYTVIERMTDKRMFLQDSSGMISLNKSQCRLQGYKKDNKYILYPNQCWFIKGA